MILSCSSAFHSFNESDKANGSFLGTYLWEKENMGDC